jgi:peptidyl-prolyl cis-trans isomerase D
MLQNFRDSTGKWFIKTLLWAIVASFALWGISDIIRNYFNDYNVARVNGKPVTYSDFMTALKQEQLRLQAITKSKMTSEQMKEFGIHNSVLAKLINQISFEQEIDDLGLSVADESIKSQIQNMSIFQSDGKFDHSKFKSLISNVGMNEAIFVNDSRKSLLSQQLVFSLLQNVELSNVYKEIIYKSMMEKKVFTTVSIPFKNVNLQKKASPEDLKTFYEVRKNNYMVPECRDITLLFFSDKDIEKNIKVTDEEISTFYEKKKGDYYTPETRDIKKISYSDKTKGKIALEESKKGKNLDKIKKAVEGGNYEEKNNLQNNSLPNSVSKIVFSTELGKVAYIEDDLGIHLYEIVKITPEQNKSFEEVKEQIKDEIKKDKLEQETDRIKNEIDDSLASGGKTLIEISKQYNLPVVAINSINDRGLDENGKKANIPDNVIQQVLEKAFILNEGFDSGFVEIEGIGAFIVAVNKIQKAYEPKFSDIESRLSKDWEENEKKKKARDLAVEIVSNAKNLNDLTQLANKHYLTLTSNHTISRMELIKDNKLKNVIPESLLEKGFNLQIEKADYGISDNGYMVIMLQKNIAPKMDIESKEKDSLFEKLDESIKEDIMSSFMTAIKNKYKITINQQFLEKIVEN